MLTIIVFSALAVLLVWALYRRPGGVTAALALSYIAAVAFASLMEREQLRPMLALAAYNAGPGAVERAGGVPNIAETQNYVQRILGR